MVKKLNIQVRPFTLKVGSLVVRHNGNPADILEQARKLGAKYNQKPQLSF
jgi:hypothetical protein